MCRSSAHNDRALRKRRYTIDTSPSLLRRLQVNGDSAAWDRFVKLYEPLIAYWLRRVGISHADVDDLTQDILTILVREIPNFKYDRDRGSFRGWLRTISSNRLKMFWRDRHDRQFAKGGSDFQELVQQLADPASGIGRLWDQEHDRFVVHRTLVILQAEFESATWQAFRRVVIDEQDVAGVAAELGLSRNAVYIAKHRVLRRLRDELAGLANIFDDS